MRAWIQDRLGVCLRDETTTDESMSLLLFMQVQSLLVRTQALGKTGLNPPPGFATS